MVRRGDSHREEEKNYALRRVLYDKPILKLILFILVSIILNQIGAYFELEKFTDIFLNVINILIVIYLLLSILQIFRTRFKYLMKPDHLLVLLWSYAILIFIIILLFAALFNVIETAGLGYITYEECTHNFDSANIANNQDISHEYIYFSTVTFFTVGFGDVCPMGLSKNLAVILVFVGHLVSVLLVALIINNYLDFKKKQQIYELKRKVSQRLYT